MKSSGFVKDNVRVTFVETAGMLTEVRVEAPCDAADFASSITPGGPGGVKFSIRVTRNEDLHQRLLKALQGVESEVAFLIDGLDRLRWDTLTEERIPQSDAERDMLSIPSMRRDIGIRHHNDLLKPDHVQELFIRFPYPPELAIPKAFFREGMAEFRQERYLQAFWSFYFVLEGLHGNGRSSEREVVNAFLGSEHLVRMAEDVFVKNVASASQHIANLTRLCETMRIEVGAEGLLRLIVRARNLAHHLSPRPTSLTPDPFSQSQFFSLAWASMGLAVTAIGFAELKLGRRPHAR